MNKIIIIVLLASLQLASCESFYIVSSGLSQSFNCPQPGFNNCLTLQQYVDNQTLFERETENITLELEPGFHVMTSTLNLFGNLRNSFTIRTVNGEKANILCIGGSDVNNAGGIGVSTFDFVLMQDLNFIQCSRNRIGTTREARVLNVQFQSNFLITYLLLITLVEDAVLTQVQFLPSRCRLCTVSTPLLSVAESSVTIELSTFSSNLEQSFRISGIIADDANIIIENSVFANFSSSAIITRNGQNRQLSITNSTFLNNKLSRDSGGAIHSTSLNNTIDNCQFENNLARESGGAIRFNNFNSSISISRSTFYNNTVNSRGGGGAISISRQIPSSPFVLSTPFSISISKSEFTNNTALVGGALHIFDSGDAFEQFTRLRTQFSILISESEFINNAATQEGGAIYIVDSGGNTVISQSKFFDNLGSSFSGGAVYVSGANATTLVEHCAFMNNAAINGGALNMNPNGRLLTVLSSMFLNNSAVSTGGGIALIGNSLGFLETRIDDCTFISNVAERCGAVEARLANVMSSNFEFNMAENDGGAGCFRAGNIFNSTFLNNTAESGSGGAIRLPSRSVIEDSVFSGNSAGRDGGAISGSLNRVFRCIFINNRASRNGGALSGPELIEDSNFENNVAGEDGGAVSSSPLFVNNSYFSNNQAESRGGAINVECIRSSCFSATPSITIQGSTFVQNNAREGFGGVLNFIVIDTTVTLISNVFDSNSALFCGVVNLMATTNFENTGQLINTLNVMNSSFSNNVVSREQFILGGGVLCVRNADISIAEANFIANMADFVGGVMSIGGSQINVENSSFVSNAARRRGGVLYTPSNWPPVFINVTNSVFISNRARNNGGVFFIHSNGSSIDIRESTLQQNQVDNIGSRGGVFDIDGVRLELSDSMVSENSANFPGNTISACDSSITIVNSSEENYFYEITRNQNTPLSRPDAMCFVYDLVPLPPPVVTTPTIVPSATPTKASTTSLTSSTMPSTSIEISIIMSEITSTRSTSVSVFSTSSINPSQTVTPSPSIVQRPRSVSTTLAPIDIIMTNLATAAPPPVTTDDVMATTSNSVDNLNPLIVSIGLIATIISVLLY